MPFFQALSKQWQKIVRLVVRLAASNILLSKPYLWLSILTAVLCTIGLPSVQAMVTGQAHIETSHAQFPSTLNPQFFKTTGEVRTGSQEQSPLKAAGDTVPAIATNTIATNTITTNSDASILTQSPDLEQQAQANYEAGLYHEAEALLKDTLNQSIRTGDWVGEAVALSNLSLTHQQLGEWSDARCTITQAIALLTDNNPNYFAEYGVAEYGAESVTENDNPDACPLKTVVNKDTKVSYGGVLAQALDVRGQLELSLGQLERSVETWDQAIALYDQGDNLNRAALSQIHQAQALQSLGLYPLAIDRLKQLQTSLQETPTSLTKISVLQRLGDAQRGIGRLVASQKAFRQSLEMAEQVQNPDAIASAYLGLGNVARARINTIRLSRLASTGSSGADAFHPDPAAICLAEPSTLVGPGGKLDRAIACYQAAIQLPGLTLTTQTNVQLNYLSLLTETQQWQQAMAEQRQIQTHINQLPPGRAAVYAQVNFAQSLIQLKEANRPGLGWNRISQLLTQAYQQAQALNDSRAQSFALGYLGRVYELTQQTAYADEVTRDALSLSQSSRAFDIAYQWQWQLGRILKTEADKREDAITAYSTAFDTLKLLRADLVATTPDVKFSFRKSVEPVYRELVDLLLDPKPDHATSQADLAQARDVMEALQVAQLENFFQSACLDPKLKLDEVIKTQQQKAAVIYPIVLDDRLEVIVKLPNKDQLVHYPPHYLEKKEIERFLNTFRKDLQAPYTYLVVQQEGKRLYDWLIQPGKELMEAQGVDTLIFVLDGPLRKVPMAALYDGEQYLAATKAIDVVLGLEITDPEPLVRDDMNVLAAGLVNPPEAFRQQYAVLKAVETELETIKASGVDHTVIQNDGFTRLNFNSRLNQRSYSVVHLATHGQFGADRDKTFLLDAEGKIPLDDLSTLFGTTRNQDPIQLLILSACRTATGNDRDVLGIAGTTVRAGAQSAIASLWSLDDESSEIFTKAFYEHIGKPEVSRAEALRRAQKALMDNPTFNHPRYWAPYVLVGNWL